MTKIAISAPSFQNIVLKDGRSITITMGAGSSGTAQSRAL